MSALLRNMVQLADQLQALAAGSPSSRDLISVAGRLSDIMASVQRDIGSMSLPQREQALREASHLLDLTSRVVAAYADSTGVRGPTVASGTPAPTSGVLLVLRPGAAPRGSPSALPGAVQRLEEQINLVRQQAVDAGRNNPTGEDIDILLHSLQSAVTTAHQQSSLLSTSDLQKLAAAASAAMQEIAKAIEKYAGT